MKKKFMLFSAIAAILLVSVLLVGCQASGSTALRLIPTSKPVSRFPVRGLST